MPTKSTMQDAHELRYFDDPILLPYQAAWNQEPAKLAICEKGRRIGLSWGEAAEDALLASTPASEGGMDVWYISYSKEMTETFISDVAFWAKVYGLVTESEGVEEAEEIFHDGDERKSVSTFRVRFASGHTVTGLPSHPRVLRSKQGKIVIDEAAFLDDLDEVLKAAMAMLVWGGLVRVISTHNGDENPFNQLIHDIRAGKRPGAVHRVSFDDAIEQGLFRRIIAKDGKEWTQEAEAEFRAMVYSNYSDNADEELRCIPVPSGGAYLLRTVIEACMSTVPPVLRWSPPAKDFVDWDDGQRWREVDAWCRGELAPAMTDLPELPHWFGEDFGRDVDLTVIWPIQELPALCWFTPLVVELRDCPHQQQEQILFYLVDRLPRFSGGALDAGGNGSYLAERARQRYGHDCIEQIKFHESWNLDHWPPFKAALEDRTITIPKDSQLLDDLRAVRRIKGVPKVPRDARTTAKDKGKRHGDAAVAAALALFAARTINADTGPAEYETISSHRFKNRGAY